MRNTINVLINNSYVFSSFHNLQTTRDMPTRFALRLAAADILHDKSQSFTIRYQDAQWQSNGCDCGLFALVNATFLCYTNPCKVTYDQSKMREHFLQCIEEGKMAPFKFPIRGQSRVRRFRSENVDIYCVCRLPDDGSQMIQCTSCHEWFHTGCVRVTRAHLQNPDLARSCCNCQ